MHIREKVADADYEGMVQHSQQDIAPFENGSSGERCMRVFRIVAAFRADFAVSPA